MLADVCRILEISHAPTVAARLDDDEKNTVVCNNSIPGRGNPNMTIISESGLHAVIASSRKPVAKRMMKWVFGEVLQSIRHKHTKVAPRVG